MTFTNGGNFITMLPFIIMIKVMMMTMTTKERRKGEMEKKKKKKKRVMRCFPFPYAQIFYPFQIIHLSFCTCLSCVIFFIPFVFVS